MEEPIGTVQTIASWQKAKAMVTRIGWKLVQQGCEAYAKDGLWVVYKAGSGLYRCRRVAERW